MLLASVAIAVATAQETGAASTAPASNMEVVSSTYGAEDATEGA